MSPDARSDMEGSRAWVAPLLAAGFGLLWYLAVGGGPTLNPTHLDWLGGDFAQHALGWMHFRDAPWGFPLGKTPSLLRPLPMTVALSDSNPWVSLALKPFARWLPRDFQFIGPWLALCFMLQGWLGARLTGLFTPSFLQRFLGGALFVLAPVLLYRTGHDTLCAQWLLTGMLWLNLRPRAGREEAWTSLAWALLLNALASGIHPYLEVMVFALTLSLLATVTWKERHLSRRAAALALAVLSAVPAALFVAFGYVGLGVRSGSAGFGHFSSDLLTLVNPMDYSRVLPGLPTGAGQYEGFGYLGTGVLALAVAAFWQSRGTAPQVREQLRARAPLVVVLLLLALLAHSSVLTVAGATVLSIRKVVAPLLPLLSPFRASGRFIWPLHYAVLTGLVAFTLWRWRQRPAVATGMLLGAVLLQALDTTSLWTRNHFAPVAWPRLAAPEWALVDASYRHLVLVPPYVHLSESPCVRSAFVERDYVSFGDLAYRQGLTTNSGYPARLSEARVTEVCESLLADVARGQLTSDTVYVVDPARLDAFQRLGDAVTCGTVEGFHVCVTRRAGAFPEALSRPAPSPAGTSGDSPR